MSYGNEKKKKGVKIASSTWPSDFYCDYFIHIHEDIEYDIEYDIERDGPFDEALVFDPFESALNSRHQDIAQLPFDEGRGDFIRDIIRVGKVSLSGFVVLEPKNLVPVSIPSLCALSLARTKQKCLTH
jgi:hypothetical protein